MLPYRNARYSDASVVAESSHVIALAGRKSVAQWHKHGLIGNMKECVGETVHANEPVEAADVWALGDSHIIRDASALFVMRAASRLNARLRKSAHTHTTEEYGHRRHALHHVLARALQQRAQWRSEAVRVYSVRCVESWRLM